ncbi:MAG: ferrous iron transporter B [Oscillospiraceae bacterium]|nr:ferrous iron transporter B [Oscillospiraceae bacterium]
MKEKIIALAGNPNVGKSTVFNALTGLKQHTGNWAGKTVELATGTHTYKGEKYTLIDLPGTYSLDSDSPEEEIARDYIQSGTADCVIIVCDATGLERNLNLTLQITELTDKAILCLNLMDEAEKKCMVIDIERLSLELGIPVVPVTARSSAKKSGLNNLMRTVVDVVSSKTTPKPFRLNYKQDEPEYKTSCRIITAEGIATECVGFSKESARNIVSPADRFLTNKITGIPVMICFFGLLFWLTIIGANYPSQLLSDGFAWLRPHLDTLLRTAPVWLSGILLDGIYNVLTWVVAVMLPPMAIFFPLFTFLEDLGYLPRIAFNLDGFFKKAKACGKQALTMAMGFGCNACGVIGARIIASPRERLIAILTNNFVPCNGRFAMIIILITLFFTGGILSPLILTLVVIFGVIITLLMSWLLSKTLLKGQSSSFTLELPPYRKPQFGKVIIRSLLDRTVFVLGRAAIVAAPAGAVIWLLGNITTDGVTLLNTFSDFLEPFGRLIGMDGVIVLAFILGFPANEIVIPIIIMGYLSATSLSEPTGIHQIGELFKENGWTTVTALCTIIFSICHFPCSTTCMSIFKETKSVKWTVISFLLPTLTGIILCFLLSTTMKLLY